MEPPSPQIQIGRTVARLRTERKLTQEALAEKAELHSVMISRVETGRTDARATTLIKIARGLGVRAAALLDDVDL